MHPARTTGSPTPPAHRRPAYGPASIERACLPAPALELHVLALATSIRDHHPGLITHAYLAGLDAELDLLVLDLCSAGLWAWTSAGYVVPDAEVDRVTLLVDRRGDRRG